MKKKNILKNSWIVYGSHLGEIFWKNYIHMYITFFNMNPWDHFQTVPFLSPSHKTSFTLILPKGGSWKNPISPCWFVLEFWKIKLEKSSSTNQFRNWFLQATQAVKIQFEIDWKSSSSNLIFPNWFFRNQVQINRGKGWNDCPGMDALH